jgi:CBS domain-containing protein
VLIYVIYFIFWQRYINQKYQQGEPLMTAGEYCNREVVITDKDTSVTDAAILMRQHHVGDLVVVDKQAGKALPIGVLTDRDLVMEVLAQKIDPGLLAIKDIMSSELVTVSEKQALLDVLDIMQKKSVRRIIVVDEEGGLQGLLSADDVIELIAEAMNDLTKLVRHEMTREQKQRP